jgi:hypothetical protein
VIDCGEGVIRNLPTVKGFSGAGQSRYAVVTGSGDLETPVNLARTHGDPPAHGHLDATRSRAVQQC